MYWQLSFIGVLLLLYVLIKVKNKMFSESKSLLWVFGCIVAIVLPFYPGLTVKIANILGIDYAPSVLFLLGIMFLVFLIFRQEQEISILNEQMKEIAQRNAIIEAKLREIKS